MTGWFAVAFVAGQLLQGSGLPPAGVQAATKQSDDAFVIAGEVSLLADLLPKRDAAEIRPQVRLDASGRFGGKLRYRLDTLFEALVAERADRGDRAGRVTDAIVRVRDAWIELAGTRGDVRIGDGLVIWGRLDEIQPSDVINPLDAARFLLDGRAAARLPVTFVRARVFASEAMTLEGVIVPRFRRGRFDELDENTSPFNLAVDAALPPGAVLRDRGVLQVEPAASWANLSGGGRLSVTRGAVDVSLAAFRGFDGFGIVTFEPVVLGRLVERHPRFTMVSGDFETVAGEWAIRGEVAAFVEKQFAGESRPGLVAGRALEAGVGFDRRAGQYRVFGSMLLHRRWSAEDPRVGATDVRLVGSIDRQLDRDRYLIRGFAVVNPGDRAGFLRSLFVWNVRDNVALEASAAAFLGQSDDALGRFDDRDFVFGRVRWHF